MSRIVTIRLSIPINSLNCYSKTSRPSIWSKVVVCIKKTTHDLSYSIMNERGLQVKKTYHNARVLFPIPYNYPHFIRILTGSETEDDIVDSGLVFLIPFKCFSGFLLKRGYLDHIHTNFTMKRVRLK